jgi:uncharacterized phage protein (TIGR02218 family)
MRQIGNELHEALGKLATVNYLFEICLESQEFLFLTSSSSEIVYGEAIYSPKSGLSISEYSFNDSAQNYIKLAGVFEENGITKETNILGARVKIIIYSGANFQHFVTYFCSEIIKHDLGFFLLLEPESKKYHQSLVQSFSKTCRADFGDKRCKIDKSKFAYQHQVVEIIENIIILKENDKINGYFSGGEVVFPSSGSVFKISHHFMNRIELYDQIPGKLRGDYLVSLSPGCDKKFITCCKKFNNAVNFRGEPFIPDMKFLKIGMYKSE